MGYVDGFPLGIGEIAGCDPMYVHVLNGVAYITCGDGNGSTFGRRVLPSAPWAVFISADPSRPGCTFTVDAAVNESATIRLEVYDESGRLVYSASSPSPATFTFSVPAGTYRMHVYAPPLLDRWYMLHARVSITASKAAVYTSNNTQDLRPSISLKIFDLTSYWKRGYASVTVRINPAGASFTLTAPAGAFADYLLAWEDCRSCPCDATADLYKDEVWRLTFTPAGPVLSRIYSQGGLWHEAYADGRLIYVWKKDGPKNGRYAGSDPTITVKFVSQDSSMNAEATFTKVCAWR
jgi:hypothetical protein